MQPHRRVLLLNASYEALNIVSAPKALALVWRHVAEIIENDPGETIRSLRYTFQVPSVIRLTPSRNGSWSSGTTCQLGLGGVSPLVFALLI